MKNLISVGIMLLLVLLQPCSGQEHMHHPAQIDSALQLLSRKDLKPRQRIHVQLKLVSLYKMAHPDVDSLINISLAMAERRGFKFYIARSLKFRARYRLYLHEDPELILGDIAKIEKLAAETGNKLMPGWVSSLSAMYYLQIGEYSQAKLYIDSLEVQQENNSFTDKGLFHTIRGMYFQEVKEYSRALAEYKVALTKKLAGKSWIYNNMARLHVEMDNFEQAERYVEMSIDHGDKRNHIIPKIASLIIKGDIALARKDTVAAIDWYEKANDLRNVPHHAKNYSCLARLISLYQTIDPERAEQLMFAATHYEMADDYPSLLVEQGLWSFKQQKHTQARKQCNKGLSLALKRNDIDAGLRACDCLLELSEAEGNDTKKAEVLATKVDLQQKQFDQNRIKALARNLANYESEKEKALLMQAHDHDQKLLGEKVRKLQWVGGLVLLVLILSLYYWRQLKKRSSLIEEQNEVISKALAEKDILLREIHHRVKNNLQLVSSLLTLQGRSIDDKMAQQAIQEGKLRVRSMALIHQDLYNKDNLLGIGVKEYIEKLSKELFLTYRVDKDRLSLELEIEQVELDVDTLIPLGLIINELLTNALKYAFPTDQSGVVRVSLQLVADQLRLTVSDNGTGYNPGQVRENSFGSTLVQALTDQLGGEMSIDVSNGTNVTISMTDYQLIK